MDELFHSLLQDVYYAEKQLLKTLPKLAKKSTNINLQEAFSTHRDETEEHIARLEKVFELIGKRPRGKTCDAILGIIAEGEEVIEDVEDGALRDAGILPRKRPSIMRSRAMEPCANGQNTLARKKRRISSIRR
jgi:ferritin-like metal-binding protein YciE